MYNFRPNESCNTKCQKKKDSNSYVHLELHLHNRYSSYLEQNSLHSVSYKSSSHFTETDSEIWRMKIANTVLTEACTNFYSLHPDAVIWKAEHYFETNKAYVIWFHLKLNIRYKIMWLFSHLTQFYWRDSCQRKTRYDRITRKPRISNVPWIHVAIHKYITLFF